MKFGYSILYVADVERSLDFYERAFGQKRGFLAEEKTYGELDTGATKLGFVKADFAKTFLKGFRPNNPKETPGGFEVAFVTDDVQAAFDAAVKAGAMRVVAPEKKPWGQTVSYVRDLDGVLVEICSRLTP
jgi:lactoylglutathione lyase